MYLDSDVDKEIRCDEDSSLDPSVPNSKVVSKSTFRSIKPYFNNPSVGKSSKSSSDSKKKPWLNEIDIIHPKVEGIRERD